MTSTLVFQLGREAALALAELGSVFRDTAELVGGTPETAILAGLDSAKVSDYQERLGGTIKIGVIRDRLSLDAPLTDVTEHLAPFMAGTGVRDFGISLYGSAWTMRDRNALGIQLKKYIRSTGQGARFASSKELILSSVYVRDQLLTKGKEFWVIRTKEYIYLAETLTVQDWYNWSRRDFDRPVRDARRGMLPPKLARMLVNFSEGALDQPLLDPFCGVGTVLQEAGLLGFQKLYGSDIDSQAIRATEQNLAWLRTHFPAFQATMQLSESRAEALTKANFPETPKTVVSEANLGPSDLQRKPFDERIRSFQALLPQYDLWLKSIYALSNKEVTWILAYPVLLQPRTELPIPQMAEEVGWHVDKLLPDAWTSHPSVKKEYTNYLEYARPDQLIGRAIVRLVKP